MGRRRAANVQLMMAMRRTAMIRGGGACACAAASISVAASPATPPQSAGGGGGAGRAVRTIHSIAPVSMSMELTLSSSATQRGPWRPRLARAYGAVQVGRM
eukprot:3145777-Prymnesium_polylepis.2